MRCAEYHISTTGPFAFVGLVFLWLLSGSARGKDWPQWGGTDAKNMVSVETALPDSFVPGEKDPVAGEVKLETTRNVRWGRKLCEAIYSTPVVADGKIFIGGKEPGQGLLACLEEKTGKVLWRWEGPARKVPEYSLGDKRRRNGLNKNDGTFVGMSEIIGTPVFHNNRIYVATGRDPEHGRGRGALHCIDATKRGDITQTGRVWTYQGLDRTLSTVSIAGGLVYISDVGGRLHCLDAETGQCYWVHETNSQVWGSTLVADGKVYMPTPRGLFVLAAGKEKKVLSQTNVGAVLYASPVVANGTLYIASKGGWLWAVRQAGR